MGFFNSKKKSSSSTSTKLFNEKDLAALRDLTSVFSERAKANDLSGVLNPILSAYEDVGGDLDVDAIMSYYEPRAREAGGQSQQAVNRAVGSNLGTGRGGNALASLVANQIGVDTERGLASKRAELEAMNQTNKQNWFANLGNLKAQDDTTMVNLWNILRGADANTNTVSTVTLKPSGIDRVNSSLDTLGSIAKVGAQYGMMG